MALIRLQDRRAANPEQDFVREFKQGFQYVWASPLILSSIVAAYTFSIFIVTYQRFMPVFAKEIFEVGPDGLGLADGSAGNRCDCIPDFSRVSGRALEPGMALVDYHDSDAYFSHSFLPLPGVLDFRSLTWRRRSRTGQLPHHQPSDHSDRDAAGSLGTGDECL